MAAEPIRGQFHTYRRGVSATEWQLALTHAHYAVFNFHDAAPHTCNCRNNHPATGHYECRACHEPLYKAKHQIPHNAGYVTFIDKLGAVTVLHSKAGATPEALCGNCGGYLCRVTYEQSEWAPTHSASLHHINGVRLNHIPDLESDEETPLEAREDIAEVLAESKKSQAEIYKEKAEEEAWNRQKQDGFVGEPWANLGRPGRNGR